jgi:hypothetical protein
MRGEDHHAKVLIDLEDSFSGATRSISRRVPELTGDGHVTTRIALHLQRDLGVKLAGAALALDLLERIDELGARLRALSR